MIHDLKREILLVTTPADHTVLKPGTGIDLVKNLHSLSPTSHASVIFEANPDKHTLIVAVPGIAHAKVPDSSVQLHVTTMVHLDSGKKKRVGFPCEVIKAIPEYRLSNGNVTPALALSHSMKSEDVNVRAAFRFSPTASHEVLGKLVIANHEFFSGTHFRICDISTTGLGLVIPRTLNKMKNPLTALETGRMAKMGIVIRDHSQEKEHIDSLDTAIAAVRVNRRFNELSIFVGWRFTKIESKSEEILSHFIHNAQLHEIRRITHT